MNLLWPQIYFFVTNLKSQHVEGILKHLFQNDLLVACFFQKAVNF